MTPRRPRKHRKVLPPLGDAVAAIAQPIARALDRMLGTDIQHCQSCARRRQKLNALTSQSSSSTDH